MSVNSSNRHYNNNTTNSSTAHYGKPKTPYKSSGSKSSGGKSPRVKRIMNKMETRTKKAAASPNTPMGRQQAAAKNSRVTARKAASAKAAKRTAAGKSVKLTAIPSKKSSTKFQRNQAIRTRAAQVRGIQRAKKRA